MRDDESEHPEPTRFPSLRTLPRRVGVVVATRNRAHLLPIALHSIQRQTHKPERILVVDDGSTDHTREVVAKFAGVEYHYVDLGNGVRCSPAKRYGFDLLTDDLPYVCCVDDDDWIEADYLEKCLDALESDCRAGVAVPRLEQHDERDGVWQGEYTREAISRSNVAPSTSLMRSDALCQIGGWPIVAVSEHEDWSAWRRMAALGWRFVAADTTYHYRRHEQSQTFQLRGGNGVAKGANHIANWSQGLDKEDLITIAIPFCGRNRTVGQMVDFLDRQTFPHGLARLFFLDNSCDQRFGRRLRQWLSTCDYNSYTYYPVNQQAVTGQSNQQTADAVLTNGKRPHATEIMHRAAGNWNRIAREVNTDLVWCLEDDVIPPDNCLDRLLRAFGKDVDAVSATYPTRGNPTCAKDFTSLSPLKVAHKYLLGGVERVGQVSFGCVLVRRQTLQSVPMRSLGEQPDGHQWYDWNFWADVARQGGVVKIDGDVVCRHLIDGSGGNECPNVATADGFTRPQIGWASAIETRPQCC